MGNLIRAHYASAGAISEVSLTSLLHSNRLISAVRDGNHNLKVIAWDVDENSNIQRKGDASAETIKLVEVSSLSISLLVTAVEDSVGNLKIIAWHVDASGNISRISDASAGAISQVAISSLDSNRVATSVRDGGGNLKVIIWHVDEQAGKVFRLGDASAGAVSQIATTSLGSGTLFSAVRDGGGNVKAIVWDIDTDGNVTRRCDASAGAISNVAIGEYGATCAVTHLRDGSGRLKLILWYVDADKIVRGADHTAYAINEVVAAGPYITAARNDNNDLIVTWWQVTAGDGPKSGIINHLSDALAGTVSKIAVAHLKPVQHPPPGEHIERVATGVRDGGGNLKIIIWHVVSSSTH